MPWFASEVEEVVGAVFGAFVFEPSGGVRWCVRGVSGGDRVDNNRVVSEWFAVGGEYLALEDGSGGIGGGTDVGGVCGHGSGDVFFGGLELGGDTKGSSVWWDRNGGSEVLIEWFESGSGPASRVFPGRVDGRLGSVPESGVLDGSETLDVNCHVVLSRGDCVCGSGV